MKNAYLLKREAETQVNRQIMQRITGQFYVDTLQTALARYTKLDLGYQRIMEICELWDQVREEYWVALSGDTESDVAQNHLDSELLQIAKDPALIIPFPERYPELRKITYGGKKK